MFLCGLVVGLGLGWWWAEYLMGLYDKPVEPRPLREALEIAEDGRRA